MSAAAETYSDSESIACPHCDEMMGDLWDHDWSGGREDIETECGWCEQPIVLIRRVSASYTCRRAS